MTQEMRRLDQLRALSAARDRVNEVPCMMVPLVEKRPRL